MQTRSRVFDDLAKVAGGAASTLSGIKAEIEVLVRQQIERLLLDADMVPRDEFDAVKAMAANARSGQEAVEKRLAAVERKLGVKAKPKTKPKARAAAKAKPKARTAKAKAKPKAAAKKAKPAKAKAKPRRRAAKKPAAKRKPR